MKALLGLVVLLFGMQASAQVWNDRRSWDDGWEQKYQEWVRDHWQKDFFSRRIRPDGTVNPYYGLRLDCADVVYSMRAIFAYENELPFEISDPTGGKKTITNRMSRFNGVGFESRIRPFLAFLYGVVATKTLPNDTFPVAISPEWIKPGTLILTTKTNHHSWSVKEILPIGVPWLVYNSRVSATSSLVLQERQSWPNPFWVFEKDHSPSGNAGFRVFRPASALGKPVWEVPGYSEEQYRVPLNKWVKFATARLAQRQESHEQQLRRLLNASCEGLQGRVEAVRDGVLYLARNRRCMNYDTYDNYSTPNRDQRFFDDLVALRAAYADALVSRASLNADLQKSLEKIFPFIERNLRQEASAMRPQSIDGNSQCAITYASGRSIDLAEAKRRLFAGLMSNNPHDDLEYRWGEKRGPSPLGRMCRSWDLWTPNLNQ
ncbi:MAG: hypothetical protein KF802_05240 [Bdellovibrionaceae bacterium]|nr:hypothetical protein [Pseudobdellovibrionaceae bacterium]MBX3032313.1 hypothetical protein [Pseudobdellovibrionaceae bacterium]